jgi:hypothetical protein
MKIIDRLKENYGYDTPIFLDEIKTVMSEYSTPYVFRCIRDAVEKGELIRYDESIYYIPTDTTFGKSLLNPYSVITKKYMKDGKNTVGFFSGWTLLNLIG